MNKTRKRIGMLLTILCACILSLALGVFCACNSGETTAENSTWYYGASAPKEDFGKEGDYYLNTSSLASFVKSGDEWQEVDVNWYYGTEAPLPSIGQQNDFYLNTESGELYQKKAASDWGSSILTLKGQPGRDGVIWFSGDIDPNEYPEGDPALKDALKGDFYLNTSTFAVWQLGADDEWTPLGSIAGKGFQNFETKGNRLTVTFTDGTEESFTFASCLNEHTFGEAEPTTIVEAGCTTRGLVMKTCTVCGMNVVESVEALGHQFADGVCTVCGKNQLEGHYETNEEGKNEVTISPDLVEEGGDLTIASTLNGAEVTVKEAVSEEVVEENGYAVRQWLRGIDSAKTNPNVNLHIGTLVIQEGVNVGPGAFAGATIEHLVLEGNATYGAYAFRSVKGLEDVTIKGETTLGGSIFYEAKSLVSVDMSDATIKEIPEIAFAECSSLSEVTLPEAGLESIEINAFLDCSSLQEIVLPEGITTIKECAFSGADIREIVFPKSLSEIQIYVFQNNKNLSKAVFQTKIESATFGNSKSNTSWSPSTIFRGCGSRDVPLQLCYTGSKENWSEFESLVYAPNSQKVVYDYELT